MWVGSLCFYFNMVVFHPRNLNSTSVNFSFMTFTCESLLLEMAQKILMKIYATGNMKELFSVKLKPFIFTTSK